MVVPTNKESAGFARPARVSLDAAVSCGMRLERIVDDSSCDDAFERAPSRSRVRASRDYGSRGTSEGSGRCSRASTPRRTPPSPWSTPVSSIRWCLSPPW